MKRSSRLASILSAVILAAGPARSAIVTWTNDTGGSFTDAANWNSGAAPGGGDTAQFTNDTAYTINFPASVQVATNLFSGRAGVVTLDISGFTFTTSNLFQLAPLFSQTAIVYQAAGVLAVTNGANNAQFIVGQQGAVSFFLTNGTLLANRILLGNASTLTSQGTLVISGSSSVMIASNGIATNPFVVGAGANDSGSQLILTNGGRLFSAVMPYNLGNGAGRNHNRIIVTGAGSALDAGNQLMRVGSVTASGNSLWINAGGLVTNLSRLLIGDGGGSNNTVSVTDGGKLFVTGAAGVQVGQGAGATNNLLAVGGEGAAALVSGSGSLVVGNSAANGFNRVVITNGTLLTGVNGLGVGNLVGNSGTSNRVDVFAGGTWNAGNANITIGAGFATGTVVRINTGGSILNVGTMFVIGSATTAGNALELNDGQLSVNTLLNVRTNASLRGSGTIAGNTTVDAGGLVAPGFSIGTLRFSNNLTLAGVYEAELDGTGSGSADKLEVVGQLDITGATLRLSQITPADDPAYVIASYGSLAGTFASVNGLPDGATIDYNYLGANQIAVVIPEPGTAILVGCGLALGVAALRRRQS